MTQRITISKRGYSALGDPDPKDLIFDSELNHLKTAGSGTKEITVNNGAESSTSQAHGLGVRPLVVAYFRDKSNDKWFICSAQPEATSVRQSTSINVEVYVDATNIYFNAINQAGSQKTVEIKYEFFYEGDS